MPNLNQRLIAKLKALKPDSASCRTWDMRLDSEPDKTCDVNILKVRLRAIG